MNDITLVILNEKIDRLLIFIKFWGKYILFKYVFRSLVFQVFSIFPAGLASGFHSMESGTSSRGKKLARKGS